MKRAIGDIPIVTHVQKESAGMNKLYSQSMCSVKQWRAYQAAEAMVSAEVDEVRAEADEIEPGWSSVSSRVIDRCIVPRAFTHFGFLHSGSFALLCNTGHLAASHAIPQHAEAKA